MARAIDSGFLIIRVRGRMATKNKVASVDRVTKALTSVKGSSRHFGQNVMFYVFLLVDVAFIDFSVKI